MSIDALDFSYDLSSIIATPGRLLHLTIEMNLSFNAVQLVIFDEADRYVYITRFRQRSHQ